MLFGKGIDDFVEDGGGRESFVYVLSDDVFPERVDGCGG